MCCRRLATDSLMSAVRQRAQQVQRATACFHEYRHVIPPLDHPALHAGAFYGLAFITASPVLCLLLRGVEVPPEQRGKMLNSEVESGTRQTRVVGRPPGEIGFAFRVIGIG